MSNATETEVQFATFCGIDCDYVDVILDRTGEVLEEVGESFSEDDRKHYAMNLAACHVTCPLDLEKLANADDFTLAHDVFGIDAHMDRETGHLTDLFRPRCAA